MGRFAFFDCPKPDGRQGRQRVDMRSLAGDPGLIGLSDRHRENHPAYSGQAEVEPFCLIARNRTFLAIKCPAIVEHSSATAMPFLFEIRRGHASVRSRDFHRAHSIPRNVWQSRVLRTDGENRPRGPTIRLLHVVISSLQPTIRSGQDADVAAALALLQSAGLPTADLTSASGLNLWVLETEESLVGVIGMEHFGMCALLRSLAVATGYRQRGLGHQLVARLEREAQANGVEQLLLLTETAEIFFRTIGYEVIERRHVPEQIKQSTQFRSCCPASAVCMTKSLASSRLGVSHG